MAGSGAVIDVYSAINFELAQSMKDCHSKSVRVILYENIMTGKFLLTGADDGNNPNQACNMLTLPRIPELLDLQRAERWLCETV